MAMRGLTQFIGDIRNCANKEEERKRVDKEMANIRKHFKEATKLTAYQKKKYVWKMLYIYVLGYEVDFGHMEALNLITAQGYSEKMVGYLACVLLLSETNEFLRLIINSVKNDLMSANEEIQGLALACVANVGGREFAETLAGDVQRILLSNHSRPQARKKAALCMLRLLRKYPDAFGEDGIGGNQDQRDSLYDLLEDPSLGVVTATMSLLIGLVSHNPELWTDSVNKCCKLLSKLNHPNAAKEFGQEYVYYKTINPWLQVKILRLLQYYPPPERHEVHTKLCDVLLHIISDAQMQKNVNTNNSAHSVVFEAINYVIHMETNKELISSAVSMLGQRMTASNQPNYRYLALDAMQRMSHIPDAAQQFKKHQETIIKSLKDNDVSLRRRALDVLYSMCDSKNSEQVVGELLDYLQGGDYAIREELVLRVAILAERFSPNLQWYVDTILKLMTLAGDYVSDHIWMRVVQIVTNNEELQLYAAETCYRSLKSESVHESMIKCGGYILGEFGHHIAHKNETSPDNQFMILKEKFHACEQWETKQILISSCVKLVNVHPQIKGAVVELLKKHTTTIDAELQQRAIEYLALTAPGKETMLETVLDVMPNFPERESILTKKIKERERVSTTDRTAAQIKSEQNKDDEDGPQTVDLSASAVKSSASRAKSQLSPSQNPHNDLLDLTAEEPSHMGGGGGGGGGGNLDDLLGAPSQPAATQKSQNLGGLDDLLGGGSPPPPAHGAQQGSLMDDMLGLGIYEDPIINVQAQLAVQGNVAKILLRYTNKSFSEISAFKTAVQQVKIPAMLFQVQDAATSIAPNATITQQVQMQAKTYFSEPPKLALSFSAQGSPRQVTTWLPVHVCKFQQPVTCNKDQYFAVWGKITGAPNESVNVFKSPRPIVRTDVENVVKTINYSALQGVDPNPNNVCGAAKINLGAGDVYCVIRLEIDSAQQAYKLTVKTNNAQVTREGGWGCNAL
ncbi:Adaptor protein complex 2 subunit alpha 1 [Guillardia theta CCMP2712]|uniref:AP-2 complex subunit alpha n=1 Tax=Guillardia theta (strain CCMP2712) TaxID=905079 RepID=L1K0K8_GUITC|nr:Adaptor protein complex 2 subunit alpha 1 [Guillardia theta CCMP2712]EKX53898.1 Adaptor protein complex 2 subunit alpha 1 [Guillardia theta CCMP2712]|eukprot:XP_005840878.1 Adaptor protein complex 2 subunit alpha 1 [Guillardia theta CCMP2712]